MRIIWPARYPLVRGFAMVMMILLTILATTAALSWEEDTLGDLWVEENRPHPWPWPGQSPWAAKPTWDFDFAPVFARTVDPPVPAPLEVWKVGGTTLTLDCRVVQVRTEVQPATAEPR